MMSSLRNILPVIILINIVAGSIKFSKIDEKLNETNFRLPIFNAKPSFYEIKLVPNIREFTFSGESTINIEVDKNTTEIILHARDLDIDVDCTTLIDFKNTTHISIKHLYDIKTDLLTLKFNPFISAGEYKLNLKYTGVLHDDMRGFYRSSYLNARGEKVWLATTYFQPDNARRAFPCFDEPALKAKFKISINHYINYTAVSNMPAISHEVDSTNIAKQWTHFDVTPIISTYIICFVISDFKPIISEDGKMRIWSKPDDHHNGYYALEFSQKALKAIDNYSDIPYYSIMKKMDNFALPDLIPGGMENWGIVTYRDKEVFYDEDVTTTIEKQQIANLISHEFSHQLFGNLVTPVWWDCFWLSEGFATYFQYIITDQVEKTWRYMDQMVIRSLQNAAFVADDDENAPAMNNDKINSSTFSDTLLNNIVYSKAGSVLRMIANSIGETIFQMKIKSYLNNRALTVATSDDLFNELTTGVSSAELSGEELKKAFDSWANQPGYPVITVIRNYRTGRAVIKQNRFLSSSETEHKESWFIPINYATEGNANFENTKPSQWLKAGVNNTMISGLKNDEWVIFNKQQTGYYRVNYDRGNWMRIIKHLKNSSKYKEIHVLNRAQLLDDSFALAQAGKFPISVFLKASKYLKEEVDYIPWSVAFRAFGKLDNSMANTKNHALLKLYILRLMNKLENTVGYTETDADDHIMKLNRVQAFKWACYVGSKNCNSKAHEKLVDHINGVSKLSPDLRQVVLCAVIRTANVTIWNEMFSLFYEKVKDEKERNSIITAFGCSTDSKILNSLLDKCIAEKSKISTYNAIYSVFTGSTSNVDISFDFIDNNLEKIIEIDNSTEPVKLALSVIVSQMSTKSQVFKLQKFIDAHKNLAENLKKAVITVNKKIKWLEIVDESIGSFLKDQQLVHAL